MTPPTVLVVEDAPLWLVVEVPVEGPAIVRGRFTERAVADREACWWLDLHGAA